MNLTADMLSKMAAAPINSNMRSTLIGLEEHGYAAGLQRPELLAHYLAQIGHESGGWTYDEEIWGPTAAQKRYEGRADLGNTQPGDGYKFRGRGAIQLTGRDNYDRFTDFAKAAIDKDAPDFTVNPDAVKTDPWEGTSALWFWDQGNMTGKSLNKYAAANDIEGLTKKINGGLNGLDDRKKRYTRAALVLLGYAPNDVLGFQREAGFKGTDLDGKDGPKTRAALHEALKASPAVSFGAPNNVSMDPEDMPELARGSIGDYVALLQALMNVHGYPVGKADGIFGKTTETQVRNLQQDADLSITGKVDYAVWRRLLQP